VRDRIPSIHIIGKPNVGKSTLFNRLVRKKKAIVDNRPGVTRDAVEGEVRFDDRTFRVVDTCGLFGDPGDEIEEKMWEITEAGVDDGDLVLFVVDGANPPTSEDFKVVDMLRSKGVKPLLVANKTESQKKYDNNLAELYQLGLGDPIPVSAEHGYGVYDMLEIALERLEPVFEALEKESGEDKEEPIRVAIVGKPNVGKSLLFNALLERERSMVTEIAGTTRDAIDAVVEMYGKTYTLVDTAGMRRKNRVRYHTVESYSILRAQRAIESADVCVILLDINSRISDQDKKIAGFVENAGKPCVVCFNKVDLLSEPEKEEQYPELREEARREFYFIPYSQVLFISGKEKTGMRKLFNAVDECYASYTTTFGTGAINTALERIKILVSPPSPKGKRIRMYYATQVGVKPPVIKIFVNYPKIIPDNYKRAVKKHLRKFLGPLPGSPMFVKFTGRRKK